VSAAEYLAKKKAEAAFGAKPFSHSCALCSMTSCSEREERVEWEAAREKLRLIAMLEFAIEVMGRSDCQPEDFDELDRLVEDAP
jgi:hypothetical protein